MNEGKNLFNIWTEAAQQWGNFAGPAASNSMFHGINPSPEAAWKSAGNGWDEYFQLQQQWFEKAAKLSENCFQSWDCENPAMNVVKAWMDVYEKDLRRLFNIPQLGLTRSYQERMREVLDKFNLLQGSMTGFIALLFQPVEKAFKAARENLQEFTREGKLSENPKDYYQMWLKALENHYMSLFRSESYVQAMGNTLNAFEDFLVARQNFIQDCVQLLPIPTYKDMDELSKEFYLLKKQVKDLAKKVNKKA